MGTRTLIIITMLLLLGSSMASKKYNKNKPMSKKALASYGAMVVEMQKESIGTPDPNVGAMVNVMNPGDNPEEMGTYMEGDILTIQSDEVPSNPNFRWPNGLVHYSIDGTFNRQQRNTILSAMNQIQRYTCIRFRPRRSEVSYISIQSKPTGCWSSIGRTGKRQFLNLQTPDRTGSGCLHNIGTSIHELMHALGIDHEQNRNDRDSNVYIDWRNIKNGNEHNFKKQASFKGLGVNYDYSSVMHYSVHAFSKNSKPTIIPRRRSNTTIGQRKGLSRNDVLKINRLYNCRTRRG